MRWTFKWITDWDHILRNEFISWWTDRFNNSDNKNIFFHPTMTLSWMKERKVTPFFCLAESQNISVFYPLVVLKMGILRWFGPAGKDEFDYLEPLFCGRYEPDGIESFWESLNAEIHKLKKHWDIHKLRGIRYEFISCKLNWGKEDSCPGVDLSGYPDIHGFLFTKSKSFRSDTYRQIRRLSILGEMRLHIYSTDDPSCGSALDEFLRHREKRWEYTKIHRVLLKKVIINALNENLGQFSVLLLDNKPISWNFSLIYSNVFYYWIPVINRIYQNYSPGRLHLYYLLDFAIKNGLTYFDLMRGNEEYKAYWMTGKTQTYFIYEVSDRIITKLKLLISRARDQLCRTLNSINKDK